MPLLRVVPALKGGEAPDVMPPEPIHNTWHILTKTLKKVRPMPCLAASEAPAVRVAKADQGKSM